MFQTFLHPPVSYLFALFVGLITGVGVELLDIGLLSFSVRRLTRQPEDHGIQSLAFLSITFGAIFTITGSLCLLAIIIYIFIGDFQVLPLAITIILAMITFTLLIIPVFLRRRQKHGKT